MLLPVKDLKKYIFLTKDSVRLSLRDLYIQRDSHKIAYLACGRYREFASKETLIKPEEITYINKESYEVNLNINHVNLNYLQAKDNNHLLSRGAEHKHNYQKRLTFLKNMVFGSGHYNFKQIENSKENTEFYSHNEISSYLIAGNDGNLGWLEDLIIDTDNWSCKYVAFSANNDMFTNFRIFSTDWIKSINWYLCSMSVNRNIKDTLDMPFYDSLLLLNQTYEIGVYQYLEEKKKLQPTNTQLSTAAGNS